MLRIMDGLRRMQGSASMRDPSRCPDYTPGAVHSKECLCRLPVSWSSPATPRPLVDRLYLHYLCEGPCEAAMQHRHVSRWPHQV